MSRNDNVQAEMKHGNISTRVSSFYRELFFITIRWLILIFSILFFIFSGYFLLENENRTLSTDESETSVTSTILTSGGEQDSLTQQNESPTGSQQTKTGLLAILQEKRNLRYGIAPLCAFIMVLFAGASFIQDVYNLRSFSDALHYVSSSMFAIFSSFYPKLSIDDGEKQIRRGKTNLLDIIGGPGFLMVQPGNAVFLKFLQMPSSVVINRSVYIEPFETVGAIVNLDDHHGSIEELETMTIDGIIVKVKNVNFRFRIINKENSCRSLEDPYPFDDEALKRLGQNLQVNDYGLVPWSTRVSMAVSTAIREYINSNTIDFLTAPGSSEGDARATFRDEVMKNTKVWAIGAEMLWVDVGHLDIVDENIDEQRIDLWATKWISNADAVRSLGEAKRTAYEEIGRAEARADLLMRITHSLEGIDLSDDTTENLRKLFLMRTALLLENMQENNTLPPHLST